MQHGIDKIKSKLWSVLLFSNKFIGKKRFKIMENISKLQNLNIGISNEINEGIM